MQISQITPTLNIQQNIVKKDFTHYDNNTSFGIIAEKPKSKFFGPITKLYSNFMNSLTDGMAKGITKFLELKPVEKVIMVTIKNESFRKNLVAHLSALTSVILSSFYVEKTLKNKDLDPQKRKTLAINQGSVCALSTLFAYTFDKLANKKVEEVINKFCAINLKTERAQDLGKYKDGIRAASSMMIFGLMYRFIAPVIVTPIANAIGNKLNEKKEAELNTLNKTM